jgi:hypothetical protein
MVIIVAVIFRVVCVGVESGRGCGGEGVGGVLERRVDRQLLVGQGLPV